MRMRTLALSIACLALPAAVGYADDFPQGCVDCHAEEMEAGDFRLGVLLEAFGHPSVDDLETIPTDCAECHAPDEDVALGVIVHQIHFDEPDSNTFVTEYGGDCRHCHVMDAAEGKAVVKSGPKNW